MDLLFQAIWQGLVLGMLLCISIGPGFFALLRTSLNQGYQSGIALAIGIFLSDTTCVFLAYQGASKLFTHEGNKFITGVIGGTIVMVFGIFYIVQKKSIEENSVSDENIPLLDDQRRRKGVNYPLSIAKGFILNIINPFVILLWLSWVGIVSSNINFKHIHIFIFFATTLLTVLTTDILKALAAHKIKQMLNAQLLERINRLVGVIMVGCGIWMIYRVF
ncbi:MAG TPA: LysE family transporter [Bacteroidia bacterium]|jgi:threonine/homoserine/homoserine lactone efflux protein